jgi:hypothetical protein
MRYLNVVKALVIPAIASLCTIAIVSLQLPKANYQPQQSDRAELLRQEESEKLRLSLLEKMPVFGFDNLVADWTYLNFIQYFGDTTARQQTGYSVSPEYFAVVVRRNSRLVDAYFYLSPATSIFAGRPDRSVALVAQGLQSITPTTDPKAYLLWFYKGADELLFLGDDRAARHSYEMAAEWASTFGNNPGLAARARETARFLAKSPKSIQARIGAWAMILDNARDDATRQIAILNIQKLGGEVTINSDGLLQIKTPAEAEK